MSSAPVLIVGDQRGGGIQNLFCGAVVLFQNNHLSMRKIIPEFEDVAHICPSPAVDGLIVVSHYAYIGLVSYEFMRKTYWAVFVS